jgi:uncharacterized membrane protein
MKILKHIWRLLVLWFVLGMCYVTVELLWRGVTYLPMIFVGGLCGLCVGLLNQRPLFCDRKMWQQCLIGAVITLIIEFFSGYILNIKLELHIWDYSKLPFNVCGQICLPYAALWFILMPFAIYLDDWLRWKLFYEPRPHGGPFINYGKLISGR